MDDLKQNVKKALDDHILNQLNLTDSEAAQFASLIKQKTKKRRTKVKLSFLVPTTAVILVLLISGLLLSSLILQNNGDTEFKTISVPEIKMKSEEEQKRMLETFTYDDYKRELDAVVTEADRYKVDEKLKKWIIRTLGSEKLYYETDLTAEEVIQLSKKNMEVDRVWKEIAKSEYGITVTEEEIDNYIKEGPDASDLPQHLAYAATLGLSLEELNHGFDRDIYIKNVIWLKLRPELEKKFGITDNNKLVEKYEEEVRKRIEK
jgi:cell division protein FtsL